MPVSAQDFTTRCTAPNIARSEDIDLPRFYDTKYTTYLRRCAQREVKEGRTKKSRRTKRRFLPYDGTLWPSFTASDTRCLYYIRIYMYIILYSICDIACILYKYIHIYIE